jgi:hypothetical protein
VLGQSDDFRRPWSNWPNNGTRNVFLTATQRIARTGCSLHWRFPYTLCVCVCVCLFVCLCVCVCVCVFVCLWAREAQLHAQWISNRLQSSVACELIDLHNRVGRQLSFVPCYVTVFYMVFLLIGQITHNKRKIKNKAIPVTGRACLQDCEMSRFWLNNIYFSFEQRIFVAAFNIDCKLLVQHQIHQLGYVLSIVFWVDILCSQVAF